MTITNSKLLVGAFALVVGMAVANAAGTLTNGNFSLNNFNSTPGTGNLTLTAAVLDTWYTGSSSNTTWTASDGTLRLAIGGSDNAIGIAQVIAVDGVSKDYTLSFDFNIASTFGDNAGDDLGVGIWTWNSTSVGAAPFLDMASNNVAKTFQPAGGAGGGGLGSATAILNGDGAYDLWIDGGNLATNQGGVDSIEEGVTSTYTHTFTLPAGHDRIMVGFTVRNQGTTQNTNDFFIDNVALAEATPEPLGPPKGLSAIVSNGTVQLDWDDSSDPLFASFKVYRSETQGSGHTLVASGLTTSSYMESLPAGGATYYYVVSQVDGNGIESDFSFEVSTANKPNILMIVVDDLNTWANKNPIRYPGNVVVPNIERLADSGVNFVRACTAATICVPSRTSFISGVAPWRSGVYSNQANIGASPILQQVPSLFQSFHEAGYHTAKRGKITHGYSVPSAYWSENSSGSTRDQPYPSIPNPSDPTKVLPLKGWGSYGPEGDWGVIDDPNNNGPIQEVNMQDYGHASWAANKIQNYSDNKPFFIAVGFFHPHYPWHAPQKYFDMYPPQTVALAPADPNDQNDIPAEGKALLGAQHDGIVANNDFVDATRAYLACISFVDAQVGRVLDALDASPHAANTIVILISDHGYHVGEKQHWFKGTTWEESVNAHFIVRAPGVTPQNQVSPRMVSHLDIYPTLVDLAGLEPPPHLDGRSIVPLLQDPQREWDYPAISTYNMHMSIASEEHRYIRYTGGSEELYDRTIDPNERNNVANNVAYRGVKNYLKGLLPAPEEMAPDRVDGTSHTLTFNLNVQSSGPGGGYIQLSPVSNEGVGIIPIPETPGPISVQASFRAGRNVLITPVNFGAQWQIGTTTRQDAFMHQASKTETITGTLNIGTNLGTAYSAWSALHGGAGVIGGGDHDFDKDGDSNYKEYSLGGDPTDPADTGIKPTLVVDGGNVRFDVPQRTGDSKLSYFIESKSDLGKGFWNTNQYMSSGSGGSAGSLNIMSYFYPMNDPRSFYRVSVEGD